MESAFAWLGAIFEWFGQWIPRWKIINANMGGVKFVKGANIVRLDPGIHFYWPVTTNIDTYPTARQTIKLTDQTLTTADNRTISVTGMVTYRIFDVVAIIGKTYDADNTIAEVGQSAVIHVLSSLSWAEIQHKHHSGELSRLLKRSVKRALRSYGVGVMKATLVDLAVCRVLKVSGWKS